MTHALKHAREQHEHDERALRKAAHHLAEANHHEMVEAVKSFGKAQVDWYNSIPRDARMVPVR